MLYVRYCRNVRFAGKPGGFEFYVRSDGKKRTGCVGNYSV